MTGKDRKDLQPSQEQLIYANLLLIGVWSGIAILLATYAIYLLGILPAHVDLTYIPKVWGLGVSEYLHATNSPAGWGWIALLGTGDYINYIGFILLGFMTVICFMVLVRGYFRQKNWTYLIISLLEILVLCLAASGIFGGGGH